MSLIRMVQLNSNLQFLAGL